MTRQFKRTYGMTPGRWIALMPPFAARGKADGILGR